MRKFVYREETLAGLAKVSVAVILSLTVLLMTAQGNSPEELDRSKPPLLAIPEEFFMPEYAEATLDNGIAVRYIQDAARPLFFSTFLMRGGALGEHKPGITSFMISLLRKGTQGRTAMQFAEEIDALGGTIRASCGWDSASISLSVLAKHVPMGMQLLVDALTAPAFAEEEIARAISMRLAGIAQQRSDPSYLAGLAFTKATYKGHPFSIPATGTPDDVQSYTAADCRRAYRETMYPENIILIAGGSLPMEDFVNLMNILFATWEPSAATRSLPPAPTLPQTTTIGFMEKKDASQTEIIIGFPVPGLESEEFPAIEFINAAFGGAFSSRLSRNIREDKGFTYGISSYFDTRRNMAMLMVQTSVGNEVTKEAIAEILKEIDSLRAAPLSDEEIHLFKHFIPGSAPMRSESPRQVAALLATILLYNLPADYYITMYSTIAALSKEELFEVQQNYFSTQRLFIGLSGNPDVVLPIAQELGEVSVFPSEELPLVESEILDEQE